MNTELIQKAEQTSCFYWQEIDKYIEQATDEATRKQLIAIQRRKYHQEEYKAGCL